MAAAEHDVVDTAWWEGRVVRSEDRPRAVSPDIRQLLRCRAAADPDDTAVIDGTGRWSYAELDDLGSRISAWLRCQGVRRGDRVAARALPTAEFVALLYGVLGVGAVLVPLHTKTPAYQRDQILADAEPAVVVVPAGEVVAARRAWTFQDLLGDARACTPDGEPPDLAPDSTAFLLYTSGSSSAPKGVVCSHGQVAYAVGAIAQRLRYRADDVVLCPLSLAFDYGLYQVLLCAESGAAVALVDEGRRINLVRVIGTTGATVVPIVPTIGRILVTLVAREPVPPPVRLITNTGEALNAALQEQLLDVFPQAELALMYGLTECKRVSIARPARRRSPSDAAGAPLAGTGVVVVDDERRALDRGHIGEVVVLGRHVADGYWRDPALTRTRFARCRSTGERVLFTGDRGWLDDEGEVHVVGRTDSIFKNAGVRVSAAEVEAAAQDVPGVEAAVLVPPTADEGEVLWFTGASSPAEVVAALRDRLQAEKVPRRCRRLDAMPTAPGGKTDRALLTTWSKERDDEHERS